MSKRLEAAMTAHRTAPRTRGMDTSGPMQAALAAADAVLFSGAAVERMAEAMWLHRPLERVGMGEPKPWEELKPYQHDRYRAWASAALAALKEESNV